MIREALEQEIEGQQLYHARREEFATENPIPFRLAEEPFRLDEAEHQELERLCTEVADYVAASDELYAGDEEAKALLDRGKPELFTAPRDSRYLFLRPDLIITDEGFKICEIETSPFGLGLAHALNESYRSIGHETVVNGELEGHLADNLPARGLIVDSEKTKAYRGQLQYTAEKVFSSDERNWDVKSVSEARGDDSDSRDPIYRAFYLKEYDTDEEVRQLIEEGELAERDWLPSLTPHIEEKALMALIWDKRWETFFAQALGQASCEYLRTVIPKTLVVGEEQHFTGGLPGGVTSVEEMAELSASKRALVLKSSGYDEAGSWSEGVAFLGKLSRKKAQEALGQAVAKSDGLQIIQEFHKGKKVPVSYEEDGAKHTDEVRIRLTPYADPASGKVVAAKATGRSKTDFIHASSDSVNAAVGVA